MADLKKTIEESFIQYSGAVIQSRALVDVRDALKPSARQILYCMNICKYTSDRPEQATTAIVGDSMKYFYLHGDSSCLGVVMRLGQPFTTRYPLVEVGGNGGTLIESGNYAAARYTKTRLSPLGDNLFVDIKKNTISEWRDNFSDTKQYPAVLPSKGFYNLCNGTQGISVGIASCIPQFNLKEMNEALIYLLNHPDCDFEDIYCAPDFATGAILYNEAEVKEALKNGSGSACKLRSVVEFDSKEYCFVVKEIPYGVYTNTICGELEEICNGEENPGIVRFNDLTGKTPLIKIYLSKKANPEKVLKYLYKNTSLQYYYGVNLTMLDRGRYPKVFTWKEALSAFLDHEEEVYTRGFQFDLNKIKERLPIIRGLLKAYSMIDQVIQTIKESSDTKIANDALRKLLDINEAQAKAILDLKLSRLSKLDITKLTEEYEGLEKERERIEAILNDENLLKKEIENGLREVAEKFGDERRTKILDLSAEGEEEIEKISLQISLTNKNNIYVTKVSSLFSQKRGGAGTKIKLDKDEFVVDSVNAETSDSCLAFTTNGNYYTCKVSDFAIEEKTSLYSYCELKENETICAIAPYNDDSLDRCIVFITKNGLIKKSEFSEYSTNRRQAVKALNLDEDDEIVSILFSKNGDIGILTKDGFFVIINISNVRAIGRVARGVKGIGLRDDDYVISAKLKSSNVNEVASISSGGLVKKTPISEFPIQGRGTKGQKIQKLTDGEIAADFLFLSPSDSEVSVCSTNSCIKIKTYEIPVSSRGAQGVKAIKLKPGAKVIKILS